MSDRPIPASELTADIRRLLKPHWRYIWEADSWLCFGNAVYRAKVINGRLYTGYFGFPLVEQP